MATRLLAPSMGEGIDELTVVNWLKKEGETVKELEGIVELETDKVTTEIPSPAAGTILKILATEQMSMSKSVQHWPGLANPVKSSNLLLRQQKQWFSLKCQNLPRLSWRQPR